MRQTLAPSYKLPIKDVKVARKNIFSAKVVDTIIKTVEDTISKAQGHYEFGNNKVLDMFSDLLYDKNGYKRFIKFQQYGTFYIVVVFDNETDKFHYLAYSVYDIIDYFNSNITDNVPYVKIFESTSDLDFKIYTVETPLKYSDERAALNEAYKYIIDFGIIKKVLYSSLGLISVSSTYIKSDFNSVSKSIIGNVTFNVGDYTTKRAFIYEANEIDNSEYSDLFNTVDSCDNVLNLYAPYGIDGWVVSFPSDPMKKLFPTSLTEIKTINGPIVFTATLTEAPEEEWYDPNDPVFDGEDNEEEGGETDDEGSSSENQGSEGSSGESNEGTGTGEETDPGETDGGDQSGTGGDVDDPNSEESNQDTEGQDSNTSTGDISEEGSESIPSGEETENPPSETPDGTGESSEETGETDSETEQGDIPSDSGETEGSSDVIPIDFDLTNCSVDTSVSTIPKNEDFIVVITANDGHLLSTVNTYFDGMNFDLPDEVEGSASYSVNIPKEILEDEECTGITITAVAFPIEASD